METQDRAPTARRKPTRPNSPDYALAIHGLNILRSIAFREPRPGRETQIDGEHQQIQRTLSETPNLTGKTSPSRERCRRKLTRTPEMRQTARLNGFTRIRKPDISSARFADRTIACDWSRCPEQFPGRLAVFEDTCQCFVSLEESISVD